MATRQEVIRALCCMMDPDTKCVGSACPYFRKDSCYTGAVEDAIDLLEVDRKAEQKRESRKKAVR